MKSECFFFMLCLKPEAFAEIIKALLVGLFGVNKLKVAFSVFISVMQFTHFWYTVHLDARVIKTSISCDFRLLGRNHHNFGGSDRKLPQPTVARIFFVRIFLAYSMT